MCHKIFVLNCYYADILSLAHEFSLAGHLAINKMHQKVLPHYYRPSPHKDVVKFCKSCYPYPVVGKLNQKPAVAPLKLIPMVEEPFR